MTDKERRELAKAMCAAWWGAIQKEAVDVLGANARIHREDVENATKNAWHDASVILKSLDTVDDGTDPRQRLSPGPTGGWRERLAQMKNVAKALDERWDHVTEDGTLGSVRGPAGEDIAQAQQRVNDPRHERRNLTAAHIANFNPVVAIKLIAVIDAARLVRLSDTGGGFNDRVATAEMLDTALASLAAALGVSR